MSQTPKLVTARTFPSKKHDGCKDKSVYFHEGICVDLKEKNTENIYV